VKPRDTRVQSPVVAEFLARNPLVTATRNARERTGDPHITATVAKGCFNLVRFVPTANKRSVHRIVLATGLTGPEVIAALDAYEGPR